jgi:hypothetical protein
LKNKRSFIGFLIQPFGKLFLILKRLAANAQFSAMVYLPVIYFPKFVIIVVFFSGKNLCNEIFDTGIFTSLEKRS